MTQTNKKRKTRDTTGKKQSQNERPEGRRGNDQKVSYLKYWKSKQSLQGGDREGIIQKQGGMGGKRQNRRRMPKYRA